MSKGDNLLVPIYAMNTDKDVWGSDAFEFKYALNLDPVIILIPCHANRPERWKSLPEAVSEHPGVWSNLMTFLGGARACIGYQFTLLEFVYSFFTFFSLTVLTPQDEISPVPTHQEVRVRLGHSGRGYRVAEPDNSSTAVYQGCRVGGSQVATAH